MNAGRIRGFLLRAPKPVLVRVTTQDGDTQEIKPGRSYAKCAETIEALDPDLIELFDPEGKLLRALRVSSEDASRSDAAPVPAGLAADPQALMLTHFANLLHRAYEHSTEVAFSRLGEFVQLQTEHAQAVEARLERVEAAHRRTLQDQLDAEMERVAEQAEQAEQGGGLESQMAGALFSGLASQQQRPHRPPSKANGAARPNGAGGA